MRPRLLLDISVYSDTYFERVYYKPPPLMGVYAGRHAFFRRSKFQDRTYFEVCQFLVPPILEAAAQILAQGRMSPPIFRFIFFPPVLMFHF